MDQSAGVHTCELSLRVQSKRVCVCVCVLTRARVCVCACVLLSIPVDCAQYDYSGMGLRKQQYFVGCEIFKAAGSVETSTFRQAVWQNSTTVCGVGSVSAAIMVVKCCIEKFFFNRKAARKSRNQSVYRKHKMQAVQYAN